MSIYHWKQLTAKEKNDLSQHLSRQRLVFILGPRDISAERIRQLNQQLNQHLGQRSTVKQSVVWGCLTSEYIPGLENSPQFKSLSLKKLTKALEGEKTSSVLVYPQKQSGSILKEISWSAVIGIYGSWHRAFHYRPEYQRIKKKQLQSKLISSFIDKKEAKNYYKKIKTKLPQIKANPEKKYTAQELLELAAVQARHSFDYTFQTGAVLAKDGRFLAAAHNKVVPYETYMLHQGASKEKHLTPPHDLNYFDTNHAEVELILKAYQQGIQLKNTHLYINLLPCPICARMLASTPIANITYQHDHSDGYGFKLLSQAGKTLTQAAIKN